MAFEKPEIPSAKPEGRSTHRKYKKKSAIGPGGVVWTKKETQQEFERRMEDPNWYREN